MSVESASILGIHLGMPAADAAARARTAGARFAGFLGSHVTYTSSLGTLYVHLDEEGRVVSVAGPRLELDDLPVAGSGSPRSELRAGPGRTRPKRARSSSSAWSRRWSRTHPTWPAAWKGWLKAGNSGGTGAAPSRSWWTVGEPHSFHLQPPAR